MSNPDTPQLISMRECTQITSLSRTAINVRRRAGTFPQEVSLGGKRFAFVRAEVERWVSERIAARTAKAGSRRAEAAANDGAAA